MKISLKPRIAQTFQPSKYIIHDALKNAVEVAIALGQPLLLTGEPGTGKTKLAQKIALDLSETEGSDFADKPLVFNTKTTSAARDLFYTYDALSHFQEANITKGGNDKSHFIELQALGKAIVFSNDPTTIKSDNFKTDLPAKPQSSVVLIDEIDKAPRDFTNDILDEIENYRFRIKEQDDYRIEQDKKRDIVIIMTSNSEKNLPDAFLRRCVFYHIPFPNDELLKKIVTTQLGGSTSFTEAAFDELIEKFNEVRKEAVRKPPATAELIAWLRVLESQNFMTVSESEKKKQLLDNLSILVKTTEDLEAIKPMFK